MQGQSLTFSHHDILTKATVDAAKMSVQAILTFPCVDLAGDWIEPTGGDYAKHKAVPWTGLEHYRLKKGTKDELVYPDDPNAGKPIVAGWARESLSEEGAPYAVEHKAFTIKGKRYVLPVGTTYYDENNRLSSQVFAMVQQDALPGVSLELSAPANYTPAVLKARSPLEPHRPAWRYDRWECHAWVNCAKPVNPHALVGKSVGNDALASILDKKQVVTGNGTNEPLHPLIFKSLARYAPEVNKSRVVVEKAVPQPDDTPVMGDAQPEEASVYDDAHEEQMESEQGTPTAQTAYDIAQMIVDVCAHAEERLGASEHVSGKRALLKELERLKVIAEKVIGVGDKVTADVGKGDGATGIDDEEEPEIEEDATEEDEEEPDKKMKAFRAPHRKVYAKAVKRFTAHEIAIAPVVNLPEEPQHEPGNSPEDIEAELKALRKFKKAQLLYGKG